MKTVVVSCLTVAAVAWSLFLRAIPPRADVQKQRSTYEALTAVSDALTAYARKHGEAYPPARSAEELALVLVPSYADEVPRDDAFGHPIRYASWADGFFVASSGRDGKWEVDDPREYDPQEFVMESPDADQVIAMRKGPGILTRSWGCMCRGEYEGGLSIIQWWFFGAVLATAAFLVALIAARMRVRKRRRPPVKEAGA